MTEKTNLTIKMDKATRDAFSLLRENIGISVSAGINALVKQAVRDQGIRFSLRDQNGFTLAEAEELLRRRLKGEAAEAA